MFIKEIDLKDNSKYKNVEVNDSEEFEGFLEVKFLKDNIGFKMGSVVLINKSVVSSIVPEG